MRGREEASAQQLACEQQATGAEQPMSAKELARLLPPIRHDAHKYTRGTLLVLAGSVRYLGAAILVAKAAQRTGAGYVSLAIPESTAVAAQSHLLSVPVIPVPETDGAFAADTWLALNGKIKNLDAVVIGPGITDTQSTREFTKQVLRECKAPILLDADALNVLSVTEFFGMKLTQQHVLTPHAGELKRLMESVGANSAQELATNINAIIVEKGPTTRIFSPIQQSSSNTGTPALATAGTGDVLSGIIGSLLAAGVEPFAAAQLGVEIHSMAGCVAEMRFGTRSVIAEDVIDAIAAVIKDLDNG